jgi:hypothetical protein
MQNDFITEVLFWKLNYERETSNNNPSKPNLEERRTSIMTTRAKVEAARDSILSPNGHKVAWSEDGKRCVEIGAEVAEFMLDKKISALDAKYILRRAGEIIEKVTID